MDRTSTNFHYAYLIANADVPAAIAAAGDILSLDGDGVGPVVNGEMIPTHKMTGAGARLDFLLLQAFDAAAVPYIRRAINLSPKNDAVNYNNFSDVLTEIFGDQ